MSEIHDDPALTAAYLKGLAAGRSEARAVPDEQAIERAADVLERWYGDSPDRLHIARAVLAAALEQPE